MVDNHEKMEREKARIQELNEMEKERGQKILNKYSQLCNQHHV